MLLVAGIALLGVGIVTGQFLIAGLGVASLAVGGIAWALVKSKATIANDPSELGAEARWLLRPIRELRASLGELATKAGDPATRVIAQEAATEADEILRKATDMASAREQLKRGLKGQGEAETNLGRLQRELASAQSDGEKSALTSAIVARQAELAAYGTARAKIAEIDGRLKVAEATLAELKARLTTGALASDTAGHEAEFSDMVQRLRTLGSSLDEAQEFVQDQRA